MSKIYRVYISKVSGVRMPKESRERISKVSGV